MYCLWKKAQKEKHMAQIKLTPEELRQSAQRYAQNRSLALWLMDNKSSTQTGMDHLIALKHNSTNCLKNQTIRSIGNINAQLIKVADNRWTNWPKISLHKSTKIVLEGDLTSCR